MRLFLSLLLLAFAVIATPAQAQNRSVWGTNSGYGEYLVQVDKIISVSTHTYVVDGAAKVTEVNVATESPVLVRYYHIDIISPETPAAVGKSVVNKVTEMAKEATGRVAPSEIKVVKNYPTTTHARTIEYRLSSLSDIERIYQSARQALLYGKAEVVKLD